MTDVFVCGLKLMKTSKTIVWFSKVGEKLTTTLKIPQQTNTTIEANKKKEGSKQKFPSTQAEFGSTNRANC